MLNKGPRIVDAVKMLATVLGRMQGHQHKKTPQLRALHAWESAFQQATTAHVAPETPITPAREHYQAQLGEPN